MLCTWFLNKVKPILLAYGCPLTNDSARLLTKLISTFGGMGGSNGSTHASIIVGFFSLNHGLLHNCMYLARYYTKLRLSEESHLLPSNHSQYIVFYYDDLNWQIILNCYCKPYSAFLISSAAMSNISAAAFPLCLIVFISFYHRIFHDGNQELVK